jgi:hypothetical protein
MKQLTMQQPVQTRMLPWQQEKSNNGGPLLGKDHETTHYATASANKNVAMATREKQQWERLFLCDPY